MVRLVDGENSEALAKATFRSMNYYVFATFAENVLLSMN